MKHDCSKKRGKGHGTWDRFASCFLPLASCLLLLLSCNGPNGKPEPTDTPTSGDVNVVVDESYSQLFDTEIYTFQSLYVNAHVHAKYLPESEALKALLEDSAKVAVIDRALTDEERNIFKSKNIFPIETKIAEDAVAFVVNNSNTDTSLGIGQFSYMISGIDTLWTTINKDSKLGSVQIVFDNPNSSIAKYLASFSKMPHLPKNAYAVKSNAEVIDYVSKNKNALGVISVNWISDRDDSLTQHFLKKIKVIGFRKLTGDSTHSYKPYQAYIKTKEYPYCRNVYMISRQTRPGLGMGFVSFVAGDKGQRIILKMGLVPAIAPTRMVEIH